MKSNLKRFIRGIPIYIIILIFISVFTSSCSLLNKTPKNTNTTKSPNLNTSINDQLLPTEKKEPIFSENIETPELTEQAPSFLGTDDSVGVILGPGGIKTFAHIGALKALEEAKVNIKIILGLEWGALIGALYGINGKKHELEWKMSRLDESLMPDKKMFGNKYEPKNITEFFDFFDLIFKNHMIDDNQIEFLCPYRLFGENNNTHWNTNGLSKLAIAKCLPSPPFFEGNQYLAEISSVENTLKKMSDFNVGQIIFINLISSNDLFKKEIDTQANYKSYWGSYKASLQDLKNYPIHEIFMDTSDVSMIDIEQRKNLINIGYKQMKKYLLDNPL